MSTNQPPPTPIPAADGFLATEAHLGRALTAIHRGLARLGDDEYADSVQGNLERARAELDAACAGHRAAVAARRGEGLDPEIVAVIAAAVAVLIRQPHRVVGVQPVGPPASWGSAWAIEGRFEHYSSHKVR